MRNKPGKTQKQKNETFAIEKASKKMSDPKGFQVRLLVMK
jgi:hypothetical protein